MKFGFRTLFFLLPFLCASQEWVANFDAAQEMAKEEQKPLLLVFSGSDWCAPCIRLDREIWQSDAFKEHAAENYILYKADFPRKKKNKLPSDILSANKKLAERYNTKGYFPLVLLLDQDSNVIGTTGYKRVTPKKYIELLDAFLQ